MEMIQTYVFYTLSVLIVLLFVLSVFKIEAPKKGLIFDIIKYSILILVSSIIIFYGKILLGCFVFTLGVLSFLILKNKK